MIIDTTCSVMERKMKEEPEVPDLTFKVSGFSFDPPFGIRSFTVSKNAPIVFDCAVVFNGDVTFNDGATYNAGINIKGSTVQWQSVPQTDIKFSYITTN